MRRFRIGPVLTVLMLLPLSSVEAADGFPENTIPTLAMRIKGPDASFITDFPIQLLCELSWLNFDAVNFGGRASKPYVRDLMSLCDSAGVHQRFRMERQECLQAFDKDTGWRAGGESAPTHRCQDRLGAP